MSSYDFVFTPNAQHLLLMCVCTCSPAEGSQELLTYPGWVFMLYIVWLTINIHWLHLWLTSWNQCYNLLFQNSNEMTFRCHSGPPDNIAQPSQNSVWTHSGHGPANKCQQVPRITKAVWSSNVIWCPQGFRVIYSTPNRNIAHIQTKSLSRSEKRNWDSTTWLVSFIWYFPGSISEFLPHNS